MNARIFAGALVILSLSLLTVKNPQFVIDAMFKKYALSVIFIVSFFNSVIASPKSETNVTKIVDPLATPPPEGKVPLNLILGGNEINHPKYIILADKQNRALSVWKTSGEIPTLIDTFPMDIGKSNGDKTGEGDFKTPEGIYFIRTRMEGPTLDFSLYGKRAFTLSYPNLFDRRAGKTGSGIWLHAIPETTTLTRGSRGCVVVRNEIIDKITPYIELGRTPVIIAGQVTYVTPEELAKTRTSLNNWIETWRSSWESKDLDRYMDQYASDFYSLKMNKETWRRYKQGLNEKYSFIKVAIKKPLVVAEKDQFIIQFLQEYESSMKHDHGEKTIYARRKLDGSFEIIAEEFGNISADFFLSGQPKPATDEKVVASAGPLGTGASTADSAKNETIDSPKNSNELNTKEKK